MKEVGISKFGRTWRYSLTICCLVGFGSIVFINRGAIARQLTNWQVLPRPERFSELYFTDYSKLPVSLSSEKAQQLAFTIHNFEDQTTTYHYELVAISGDTDTKKQLGSGEFKLARDNSQVTRRVITIPPLSKRVSVQVNITYEGIAFGYKTARLQKQSIDYWVNVAQALLSPKDKSTPT